MIKAICFNRDVFRDEVIQRICDETGGTFEGALLDMAIVNCVESYPDGRIYYSIARKGQPETYNCGNDIEKFIYVNKYYGPKRKTDDEQPPQ